METPCFFRLLGGKCSFEGTVSHAREAIESCRGAAVSQIAVCH